MTRKKRINIILRIILAIAIVFSGIILPEKNTKASTPAANVKYRTYVQTSGWQSWVSNGSLSGTVGEAKRLEGMQIKLNKQPYSGGITYRTYVQSMGWQAWKENGVFSGTKGKSLRLEALQIKLTGEIAQYFDVWYRVHAQHFGWLSWVKNGASSGTAGFGYRLESVQIVLRAKGGNNPGNLKGIKSANNGGFIKPVDKYSYEIVPLLAPFNRYYYIKTDNPDPTSFYFVDKSTKYSKTQGRIEPSMEKYEDVVYENPSTLRVSGGYIAYGTETDGGELTLVVRNASGAEKVSAKTVNIKALKDDVDYIIDTYTKGKTDFFDKMSAAESGLDSVCLYSGVYILGELHKDAASPYYGISNSPHIDQEFYIQDPYYRTGSKSMFISDLYPYRLDSIGFPSMMAAIAKKLDPSVTTAWSGSAHYLINVTKDGVTKSYGGAGNGGGQGINQDQILYRFSFDKSANDASKSITLSKISARLNEYGKLDVDKDAGMTDTPLTWSDVQKDVGEGKYARIILIYNIWGSVGTGYTYFYDDDNTYVGKYGWGGGVGYFSNVWFEGRYYNKWEYIYPGADFKDTVENAQPALVFKDFKAKLPNDGKQYEYNGTPVEKLDGLYDTSTGVWKGYTRFIYNSNTKTWRANLLGDVEYRENYMEYAIEDKDFIDACTITMDEALSMNLDRNTNKEPSEFLIYDGYSEPGTKGNN